MERAACLLARLKPARRILRDRDLVEAAWPAAVGRRLAERARILRFEERRLTVSVEDALWQRNFEGLAGHILANLKELVGCEAPSSIEFVVGAPRRLPQREITQPGALAGFEPRSAASTPRKRARA